MSIRTAIITASLLLASLVAQANVEITVRFDRTTFPVAGVQKRSDDKRPPAKQTIHLTLGARWMQWDDGSDRGVYDFAKHVSIRVDREAHRLDEESLYALLSGREAELDNRLMLGSALEAGKVEANPMAPTISEHQLSLRRDAGRASGIERKSRAGEQRYLWKEKELFAYSTELVPLPAADRDLYIRFVRYVVGGHPEILDDMQKLDGIPKWLRYSDPSFGNTHRLEVVATRETPDAPYALPALEKTTLKNPGAAAAAATVAASTPESRAAMSARILSAANEAAEAGKPIEAMLGYMESQLMTGGVPPDIKKHADIFIHDPNVRALAGALQPENAVQAKSYITTLVGLAPLAGDKAYVIGIFRADIEQKLGNGETAIDLFVAALTKDPFITGVWKDLGDSLNTGYDAGDTWRCYETARRIAPMNGLLADVARAEAKMAKAHPEYF